MSVSRSIVGLLLAAGAVYAQAPAPPGTDLAAFAARRYPQPVRVGDLIDRRVLQPLESRPVLGHVMSVVKSPDGATDIVVKFGGFLGFGGRLIAVPAIAMVLLGNELEILDFTPEQLKGFPTFDPTAAGTIAADQEIRIGLAHPSH